MAKGHRGAESRPRQCFCAWTRRSGPFPGRAGTPGAQPPLTIFKAVAVVGH